MRTGATLLLVVALATPIRSDDAKDNDGIQGTWKLAELVVVGKRVEHEITTIIRNDKIEFYFGDLKDPSDKFHVVLDSTVTPKAIDVYDSDKGKRGEKLAEGLYELDGDKLRICVKVQSGPPWNRPTAFQSTEEGKEILMVLRRDPKAE